MTKWITFDLDGTLMQNPFGKWIFPEVEALISAQLSKPYGVTKALVQEHELRMQQNLTVAAYDWDDMLQQLLKRLNLSIKIDIEQLVLKHSTVPKVRLLEESVISTLQRLKDNGFSLAVLTNGFYKYQFPVLKELGLSDWFDEILTPERVGCGKPDINMLRGLQETGKLAAHVGDRLDHDVYLANQLGVPSVLIYRELPESLRSLPPDKRAENGEFLRIGEAKLKAESPQLAASPLPQAFIPSHVLYRLDELLQCV